MTFDFSALAATYAAYRPHYPRALVDALGAGEVAWDAGCGSGQLSVALAGTYARVIATDPSAAQLAAAEPHARVEYHRAPAEAGIPGACDLAVAAQAAHWFDWPAYVAAIGRCVRPGGRACVISYGRVVVPGDAGTALDDFYDRAIASHWPAERAHVHDGYARLAWPEAWQPIGVGDIAMIETWTRDELVGYLGTWSAVSRFLTAGGDAAHATLAALVERIAATWPDGERRAIAWPLTVKLVHVGRVARPG